MSDDQVVLVLTSETTDAILARGGTGDWVLSPKKVATCKYVICCRKLAWDNRKEGFEHRAAFLIGLIAGLRKRPGSENDRGQPRFLIEISEYATFERETEISKEGRNPVSYKSLKTLGIDPRWLNFEPMPAKARSEADAVGEIPLTIAAAKKALAATFGVSPEDVEIIIRG